MVYADVELVNAKDIGLAEEGYMPEAEVRRMDVQMLVDSGAYMMGINDEIRAQLGLNKTLRRAPARLADNQVVDLDVVGPIQVRFANRIANVDAIVLPRNAKPLLGAIPMEYMDVLIDPRAQQLIVNPEHPDRAGTILA